MYAERSIEAKEAGETGRPASTTDVAILLGHQIPQIDAVRDQIKLSLQVHHECFKALSDSPLLSDGDTIPHHAGFPHTQKQIFVPLASASEPKRKRCLTAH